MALKTYNGSCLCGAIQFEADIDLSKGTGKCNCEFCVKTHAWKVFVKPEELRLISGESKAKLFKRHPQASERYFCSDCGVYLYERGNAEWMGGPFAGVYLHALNNASVDELMSGPIRYANGKDNDWMHAPADVRNL